MGKIAGNCDDIPGDPGEWQIRSVQQAPNPPSPSGPVSGPFFYFGCPRGRGTCGVPLAPSPPNPNGALWTWDGNAAAPTLSPSINCIAMKDGKKAGGCGWHGHVRAGKLTDA